MPFLAVKQFIILTVLLIYSLAAQSFPRGCEVIGFSYDQNYLVLNEKVKQSFYLIQNRSDTRVELERLDTNNAFMTPPLHISINPMNWSAFAADENVYFKCYRRNGEETELVDCRNVLDVCQYPRVRFALSNMGNYWISSNKSQESIIRDAINNGIYLKW